ncbi:MAG: hypothetical protein WBA74_04620 [Cyclobacteriaceae bacterium]
MKFFKTHTNEKEVYVWYNADLDKCLSGTIDEYESTKSVSQKADQFQVICLVGHDQLTIQELTKNINDSYA